jgi:hypothetical protein
MPMNETNKAAAMRAAGLALLACALALEAAIALNASNVFKLTSLFQTAAIQLFGAEVDPRYSGGRVIAKFRDAAGDDFGPGGYGYPRAEAFQQGRPLDLVSYAVHQPVTTKAAFMPDGYYWQLDFSLASLGPAVIHAYIDLDGAASGSLESPDGCDNVAFSPEHPWDLFVEIDVASGKGTMSDSGGAFTAPIRVYLLRERNIVLARLPLDRPQTKKVLEAGPGWHYVTVNAFDAYSPGHAMPIAARSGLRQGGGADSRSAPRVFDCLVPKGMNQAAMLGSFDDGAGTLATLEPVDVAACSLSATGMDESRLAELKKQADAEAKAAQADGMAAYRDSIARLAGKGDASLELARAYLGLDDLDSAERCLDALLSADPSDAAALSCKGLLTGMRGGRTTDLGKAVDLVNRGFESLDRAVALAEASEKGTAKTLAYKNWTYLAFGVPDFPFGKSEEGAAYCEKLADYYSRSSISDPELSSEEAQWLLDAGLLYERARMPAKAELFFMRASTTAGLTAGQRYELGARGFF